MTLTGVGGLLLDVDGTLLVHDRAIPGAPAAVEWFRRSRLPFLLLTNTSRRSRAATAGRLQAAGFEVDAPAIVTPARLARRLILDSGRLRTGLLVTEEARADLEGVVPDEAAPDWVVLGDLGAGFTFERMNAAFRWLRAGAGLIALHRNPWWDRGNAEGPVLDVGAYAAALEFATGQRAETVGKPSRAFFDLALAELGVPAADVAVVGDDVEADVGGGSAAGCRTILVKTGKGTTPAAEGRADLVLDSIADLPARLASAGG